MRNLRSEQEIMANWKGDLSKPVVSVCCIAYNHELYIEDALEGFLIQETDFPFEIIIHDDASTDKTADIIREYSSAYPNIIKPIFQTENQFSKLKMQMIFEVYKKCKGKFIAVCEGDDYWISSNKLQLQYSVLKDREDYSMSIHNAYRIDERTGEKSLFNPKSIPKTLTSLDVVMRRWFSPTASFFFRNADEFPKIPSNVNGDIFILYESSLRGSIYYLDDILSVYRYVSVGSLSTTVSKKNLYKKKEGFLFHCLMRSSYSLKPAVMLKILLNRVAMLVKG